MRRHFLCNKQRSGSNFGIILWFKHNIYLLQSFLNYSVNAGFWTATQFGALEYQRWFFKREFWQQQPLGVEPASLAHHAANAALRCAVRLALACLRIKGNFMHFWHEKFRLISNYRTWFNNKLVIPTSVN